MERLLRDRTMEEWTDLFAAQGVPVSPIHAPEEMSDDAQVEALGLMATIEHPALGTQRVVGSPLSMSVTPPAVQGPSPRIGEHTDELLRDLGGLDDAELARLREAGVIGRFEG